MKKLFSIIFTIALFIPTYVYAESLDYKQDNISEIDLETKKEGWINENGKSYYYKDGKMLTGIQEIDGKKYLFGVYSGMLYRSGLASTPDGKTYYTNAEGEIQLGFQNIKGNTYYFSNDGSMYKGILDLNGKKYLLGVTSGILYRSSLATTPDGKKYYTNAEGEIQLGFQNIKGNTYYFSNDGSMYKGILELNGKKYLLGVTSGILYRSGFATTPDGKTYYTNAEGVIQVGDLQIDGNWYRFNQNGVLMNGWQTINGNKYYFYSNGTRAVKVSKIAGKRYLFSDTGVLLKENIKLWIDVSTHQKNIDWKTLWNSGEIDGVILRTGYGYFYEDTKFGSYIAEVKKLNIPYTVYYYSYAENTAEAIRESQNMYFIYQKYGLKPCMNTYYDIEEYQLSASTHQAVIETYMNELHKKGISVKVYANKNFAENIFNSKTREYLDWIAHYTDDTHEEGNPGKVTNYSGSWKIWQYTSKGRVPGISTYVDKNIVL